MAKGHPSYSLYLLRLGHWLQRQWLAAGYIVTLHRELWRVRRDLSHRFGEQWIQTHFPHLTHSHIGRSGRALSTIAANPRIGESYRRRTAHWRKCLTVLKSIRQRGYRISQPASRQIYEAMLTRCLTSLADRPLTVPKQSLPYSAGLVKALIQWLESVGVDRDPVVVASAGVESAIERFAGTIAGYDAARVVLPQLERHRQECVRQQYREIFQTEVQELHGAYLQAYMNNLALPKALSVPPEKDQAA